MTTYLPRQAWDKRICQGKLSNQNGWRRFVSFRFVSFHTTRQENEMIGRMEQRGMNVSKLMGQHGERDDRQMVRIILASVLAMRMIIMQD
jgi:hypothetical protein